MDLRKNKYFEFLIKKIGGSGGSGDGEINTGTNIGDSGVGVYNAKVGTELQFKKLRSLDPQLTITNNGITQTIDFDLDLDTSSDTIYISSGFNTCSGIIDNGDGTITTADEEVILSSTSDFDLPLTKYTLTGDTFSIPANQTSYIVGDYNSGTPIFKIITDVELINESDIVPFITLYKNDDNIIHVLDWDCLGKGLINKIHKRLVKTQRFVHESGMTLSETAEGYIEISEGKFWYGAVEKVFNAYNSNIDNLRLYYHSSGDWTYSDSVNMFINDQYDNGTDLAVLGNNKYVNNWIYVCGEANSWAYIVLGNEQDKLANALAETIPTLPDFLKTHGILVGRITYLKDETSASRIVSAFTSIFNPNIPIDHNDLTGLTDTNVHPATSISIDVSNFEDKLSSSDIDVQKAFDTLDNHTHDATSITNFNDQVNLATAEAGEEPNGFVESNSITWDFDKTTRLLTIEPIDTSYTIYHQGKRIEISETKTLTISNTDGQHWIYFDADANLQESVNPTSSDDLIMRQVLVAYISWNSTTGQATFVNKESHGTNMSGATHLYLHNELGCRYDFGLDMLNYTNNGNGDLDSDIQFGLSDGAIIDEDLYHMIGDAYSPQTINTILNAPKLYKSGASGCWVASANSDFAGLTTGTGRLAYNNINAGGTGVWGLSEIPDKKFGLVYIIATPDIFNPIKVIIGQEFFDKIEDLRIANPSPDLIGLNTPEFKFLHRIIYKTQNSNSNALKSILFYDPLLDDIRLVQRESVTFSLSENHSTLLNRDAINSHPASAINIDSSSFDKVLSITDTNMQTALETIDNHVHDTSDIINFNSDIQSIINATSINGLSDISITSISDGQALVWNDTTGVFENTALTLGSTALNELTDTNVDSMLDGHFLIYSTSQSKWINSNGLASRILLSVTSFNNILSGADNNVQLALETLDDHNHNLDNLLNVNITSVSDGQAIVWDSSNSEWVNYTLSNSVTELDELDDVSIISLTEGQVLGFGGIKWQNFDLSFDSGEISTDTTNFNNILSGSDTDVQIALETLDDHNHNLDNLLNVNITSVSDGQAIVWDSSNSEWINSTVSSGATELNGLTDVIITTPSEFDILYYTGSGWANTSLDLDADEITVATDNFNNILSDADIDVQLALDTLDDHGHTSSDISDFNTVVDGRIALADIEDLNNVTITSGVDGDLLKINSSGNIVNEKDMKVIGVTLGAKGTDLTTSDSSYPISIPFAGTIVKVIANVNTAPVGASIIVDVNLNGTSIWNITQANRVSISASSTSGTQISFDTTAVLENDVITFDVDQVGSTTAGQDLTIMVVINKL